MNDLREIKNDLCLYCILLFSIFVSFQFYNNLEGEGELALLH